MQKRRVPKAFGIPAALHILTKSCAAFANFGKAAVQANWFMLLAVESE
jgi:hypothetical protein